MPPRIRIPRCLPGSFVVQRSSSSSISPFLPFLAPALQTAHATFPTQIGSTRASSILSSLAGIPSSYNKRIRRGRGPSSGKGKTSGRGHKGQRQHGKVPAGFEGGQTPLHIVHGKRGFTNVHRSDINTVPISRILSWIAQGRLDPNKTITVKELARSRCVSNIKDGVKLLASSRRHENSVDEIPSLDRPLHIVVSHASKQAIEAIEKVGGTVLTRFYTRFAIRRIIEGRMDPIFSLQSEPRHAPTAAVGEHAPAEDSVLGQDVMPTKYEYRLPDATSRRDIEYYRDPANRGYLSYQLKEGQNPSLFFKSPEEYGKFAKRGREERQKAKEQESALLW